MARQVGEHVERLVGVVGPVEEQLGSERLRSPALPLQLVSSRDELERHRGRAEALGAALLLDRTDDPDEPLYVLADLSGHPFCLFIA